MHRPIPSVVSVRVVRDRVVHLVFDDGVEGDVDLSDLDYGVFTEIARDDAKFAEVYVDETGTIAWPGDIDLAPEVLHEDAILGYRHAEEFPICREFRRAHQATQ